MTIVVYLCEHSNAKATRALMAYVDETQRFPELFGTLSTPDDDEEDD